jgi:hypothetical protein
MIVEAGISGAGQANDGLADVSGQAAGAGPSAVGVRQRRLPLLAKTFLETLDLTDAEREQCGGSGARHVSLSATGNYAHSLQFLLTQRERPSSHGGDIFTLPLRGDRIMELKHTGLPFLLWPRGRIVYLY